MKTREDLIRLRSAHAFCSRNRQYLECISTCGCFYCTRIFMPSEILEWVDDYKTAICPYCGIDSVLPMWPAAGYQLTAPFLKEMNDYWFGLEENGNL